MCSGFLEKIAVGDWTGFGVFEICLSSDETLHIVYDIFGLARTGESYISLLNRKSDTTTPRKPSIMKGDKDNSIYIWFLKKELSSSQDM